MPTYITLCKWTQKGIENVKDSPNRLDKAREAMKAQGAELKQFYLTMGEYDFVIVGDAPSDEAYARALLTVASRGSVSTQTLKAFSEDEYRKIIAALP